MGSLLAAFTLLASQGHGLPVNPFGKDLIKSSVNRVSEELPIHSDSGPASSFASAHSGSSLWEPGEQSSPLSISDGPHELSHSEPEEHLPGNKAKDKMLPRWRMRERAKNLVLTHQGSTPPTGIGLTKSAMKSHRRWWAKHNPGKQAEDMPPWLQVAKYTRPGPKPMEGYAAEVIFAKARAVLEWRQRANVVRALKNGRVYNPLLSLTPDHPLTLEEARYIVDSKKSFRVREGVPAPASQLSRMERVRQLVISHAGSDVPVGLGKSDTSRRGYRKMWLEAHPDKTVKDLPPWLKGARDKKTASKKTGSKKAYDFDSEKNNEGEGASEVVRRHQVPLKRPPPATLETLPLHPSQRRRLIIDSSCESETSSAGAAAGRDRTPQGSSSTAEQRPDLLSHLRDQQLKLPTKPRSERPTTVIATMYGAPIPIKGRRQ